jgi:hypothetical protein
MERCFFRANRIRTSQHLGRALGGWPGSPPRLAPPGGKITICRGLYRPAVPGGLAPRMSLPRSWGGVWRTNACEAATAASSCCDLATAVVTRNGSSTAATLAAVRGAVSETPPCRRGHPQLEGLGRRQGGDGRRHPVNKISERVSNCPSKSKLCGERRCSPQIGEYPLPLP